VTRLAPIAILVLAALPAGLADPGTARCDAAEPAAQGPLLGFTELRTDLAGGRHANVATMRAGVCSPEGGGRRMIGDELADGPDAWTQFAGWSPDGKSAIVLAGWESPDNARWEEENRQFRFLPDAWRLDACLVDVAGGGACNLTAVDRVSHYNAGLFFWPGDPRRLGFTALIDGQSRPFAMDLDGRNKQDLSDGAAGFAYGFSASPDGGRIAYHRDYQVYVAEADGASAVRVETGLPFNFAPCWSPDGQSLVFLAGEHYDCHPHVARRDGQGVRKIADRGRYRGVVEFLDVDDFHGGSSDTPAWSSDGWIYYTAQVSDAVELMRVSLEGEHLQLTRSSPGTLHYHPQPSPDGTRLAFGSRRDGVRELYVLETAARRETKLFSLSAGRAAMWPHWQPMASSAPAK
jgi:Tol biopolymer transport system component